MRGAKGYVKDELCLPLKASGSSLTDNKADIFSVDERCMTKSLSNKSFSSCLNMLQNY